MAEPSALAPILDDLPTGQDSLDFQPYVDALADILLAPDTRTPLTLGVFGSLGQRQDQPDADAAGQGDRRGRPATARSGSTPGSTTRRTPSGAPCCWRCWTTWRACCRSSRRRRRRAQPPPRELLELLREALYRDTAWTEKGELEANWTQAAGAGAGLAFNLGLLPGPGLAAGRPGGRRAGGGAEELRQGRTGQPGRPAGRGVSPRGAGALPGPTPLAGAVPAQLRSSWCARSWPRPASAAAAGASLWMTSTAACRRRPSRCWRRSSCSWTCRAASSCWGWTREAIEAAVRTRYQGEVKAREYLEKIIQLPFILPPIEEAPMRQLRALAGAGRCPIRAAPRSSPWAWPPTRARSSAR